MPHLRLSQDFSIILKQEVYRGWLVVTFEAALQHRIPKALVFLNTEVLPTMFFIVLYLLLTVDRYSYPIMDGVIEIKP